MPGMRLIAGSGRSGTTWVQDALAAANHLRPVFEPLHPYVSEFGSRYAHRALSPDDDQAELQQFLNEVCAGERDRLWTQYRRQGRWLFPPKDEFWSLGDARRLLRRWGKFLTEVPKLSLAARQREPLVKCIRANLMLGWLSRRCDWRIVLIVRHPGAVIESELRGAWNAKFALDRFRDDANLHEMTAGRYRALLERTLTQIEALAVRWVIENQWVMELAPANGVTVVFYERLRSQPDAQWKRICQALDLRRMPNSKILARPSQQSSPRRVAVFPGANKDPRWMRVLSRQQVALIQGVLDQVHFDTYTMHDPEPRDPTVPVPGESVAGVIQ